MKTNIVFALVTILGMFGLTGCRPKSEAASNEIKATPKIKLTGQMFIVTEGAENIKLGDVEVLLIEKAQAVDFLWKKRSTIDSIMQSRKQALEIAKTNAGEPDAEYELAAKMIKTMNVAMESAGRAKGLPRAMVENDLAVVTNDLNDFNLFFRDSPYITNNDFAAVKGNGGTLLTYIVDLAKTWSLGTGAYQYYNRTTIENNIPAIVGFEKRVDEIARTTKGKYDLANSNLNSIEIAFTNSPTSEDYMADFSPAFIQKTITDADGKFSLVYSSAKSYTIFGHAQRKVGTKTEQYYWLIDVPTNAESVQVFLSNHNFVTVDPGGYFQIRPK